MLDLRLCRARGGWRAVLTITDRAIRSALTPLSAERAGEGGWRVSWLAGRVLSAGQAQAAMLIAEAACDLDAGCDPELYEPGFWSRLDQWAAQLDMPGPAALALAAAALTGELTPGQPPRRVGAVACCGAGQRDPGRPARAVAAGNR
jgi:hypothetical protein